MSDRQVNPYLLCLRATWDFPASTRMLSSVLTLSYSMSELSVSIAGLRGKQQPANA